MLTPISSITIPDRFRELDQEHVSRLASSIADIGLIHPIVVDETNTLIAGHHRLEALRQLGWNDVPITTQNNIDETTRRCMELEENVQRKDMSWQERVLSLATIHQLHKSKAIKSREKWEQTHTANLLGCTQATISYALKLAHHLKTNDEEIKNAPSMVEALKILLARKEKSILKQLAQKPPMQEVDIQREYRNRAIFYLNNPEALEEDIQNKTLLPEVETWISRLKEENTNTIPEPTPSESITIPLSEIFFHKDAIQLLQSLPDCSIDHILTDPPYGIDTSFLEHPNFDKTLLALQETHQIEENLKLYSLFIPEAFRVLKPTGFLCFWYDLDHHNFLQTLLAKSNFLFQRWPLVYCKTSTCLNQAPYHNWTKATEVCMVARKKEARLVKHKQCNFYLADHRKETEQLSSHKFAKPASIWKDILETISYPQQTILDPFAGSCSSLCAALQLDRKILGCEILEDFYNIGLLNLKTAYQKHYKNVVFT